MAARLTLAQLRTIPVPAPKKDEPDHVTSLRMTLDFHKTSGPKVVVCVPDSIAAMLPTPAPAPSNGQAGADVSADGITPVSTETKPPRKR